MHTYVHIYKHTYSTPSYNLETKMKRDNFSAATTLINNARMKMATI